MKPYKIIFNVLFILSFFPILLFVRFPEYGVWNEIVQLFQIRDWGRAIGIIGLILLWWQNILGFRGFIGKVIPDMMWLNIIHQYIGKYGFLLIVLHPILIFIGYGEDRLKLFLPSFTTEYEIFVKFGQLAFVILALVWITSAVLREKMKYRRWKKIHLFSYLIVPLVLFHSVFAGAYLSQQYNPLRIYWAFLLITFFVFAISRLLFQLGIMRRRYKLVEKVNVTYDTVEYSFETAGGKITPKVGQYIYVQPKPFSESHPFTVSKFDELTGKITVSIKVLGEFTKELPNLTVGQEVFLDGPYGVFTQEAFSTEKPLVLIAGGIGITPFLRLVDKFNNNKSLFKSPYIYLIYGNKTVNDIVYKDFLEQRLPDPNKVIHVLSNENVAGYKNGFITPELLKEVLSVDLTKYEYFICGPPIMMDKLQEALKNERVDKSQVHLEKFSL